MRRLLLTWTAGMMIIVGLTVTGCKSPGWEIKNPFASKPKPEIKSPAEMDDMDLKAPPERYTKDDYLQKMEKNSQTGESLAQRGSYQSPREEKGEADLPASRTDRVAMNETRSQAATVRHDEETENSGVPGFDDFPSTAAPGDSVAPFTPGSIGDY